MATKKTSSSKPASKPVTKQTSRPTPVKKVPVQAAPHSRTLANGQPRPKRRSR